MVYHYQPEPGDQRPLTPSVPPWHGPLLSLGCHSSGGHLLPDKRDETF